MNDTDILVNCPRALGRRGLPRGFYLGSSAPRTDAGLLALPWAVERGPRSDFALTMGCEYFTPWDLYAEARKVGALLPTTERSILCRSLVAAHVRIYARVPDDATPERPLTHLDFISDGYNLALSMEKDGRLYAMRETPCGETYEAEVVRDYRSDVVKRIGRWPLTCVVAAGVDVSSELAAHCAQGGVRVEQVPAYSGWRMR